MNPGSPLQTSAPCDLKKREGVKESGWMDISQLLPRLSETRAIADTYG